ncbi:helix-turn-helix domain-containing protein [Nocardia sp. NPDC049149]|uniref:helix-turn-helix domain-containing protein n=1 Tax=Nocardia sp. NPDC049149 TaxID=3364315 RepID=UPI0037246470
MAREVKYAGGSDYQSALAVHQHCGVSLLRAHRIARNYTLVEAVEALKEILAARGTPSEGLRHQRLSQWEHGQDVPSTHYLDALCFLYRTRPDRLGFGHDYSDADALPQNGIQDAMDRRHFVSLAAAGAMFMPAPPGVGLFGDGFDPPGGRRATAAYVGLLEDITEQNGYQLYAPPAEFIPARMVDLARAEAGLLTATSEEIRRRLQRVYAKNSGFIAIRLTDVASAGDAFEWYGIARRAARLADDATVQAWIAARTGDACAWHHQFKSGMSAAYAAQSVGARRANSSAVMGYLAEAGVQARLGRRRETLEAIRSAERMFAELPEAETVADGFRVSEYLLRWHQANSLALVGAHAEAAPLRAFVRDLPLANHDQVGWALLNLDEAAAHIAAGELESGCHTITTTWQQLATYCRVGQVQDRVLELLQSLDSRHAVTRQVAEVRELVESGSAGRETAT